MSALPIVLAVLVGVITYAIGVFLVPKKLTEEGSAFTKKQLKSLASDDLGLVYEAENDLMRDRFQSKGIFAKIYYSLPLGKYSQPHLVSAGMSASVDKFCVILISVFVISLIALPYMNVIRNPLMVLLAAVGITYFAAWRIIKGRTKKRVRTFMDQFPDALDIIVRSVKSGFPLNAAVNMVAESMPAPTSEEFKQMSTEVLHGSTLVDALDRLGKRMHSPDIRFFVVVLTLQQEVGGSLAEVLSNLSLLIRKRKMMLKKVHAITSEGRFTGWILGGLPLFVALAINAMSPDYLPPLFNTSSGNFILGMVVASVLIGILIIRKMVDLEI